MPHAATNGAVSSLALLSPPAGVAGVAGEEADTFPGERVGDDGDAAVGERAMSVGWNVPVEMTVCHITIASLNDCQ